MRSILAIAALLATFATPALAEGLLVLRVTVEVQGNLAANVHDANVSGDWLESWKRGERRDVTLQPVNDDGRANGPPRLFKGCVLREMSGAGNNVVGVLRLTCSS